MVASVFLVATALPIVKWALMLDLTPRKVKILYAHHVLVVEFVLPYAQEVYSSLKIPILTTGSRRMGLSNNCR